MVFHFQDIILIMQILKIQAIYQVIQEFRAIIFNNFLKNSLIFGSLMLDSQYEKSFSFKDLDIINYYKLNN